MNLLEEAAYLGSITVKNVNIISRDFDEELYTILSNLGIDLKKVLDAARVVTSSLSPIEFYNQLLSLVSDSAKYLYGFDIFSAKRLAMVAKLKDIHGSSLMEFLNYLITRDKFVDKVGLQSDLVVLHYKFGTNNFMPKTVVQVPVTAPVQQPQNNSTPQIEETPQNAPPPLVYADLQKMSNLDQGRVLRQRRNQKLEQAKETEKVPVSWPLSKDERTGEHSMDEINLTPQEFSQNLYGGRGGGS